MLVALLLPLFFTTSSAGAPARKWLDAYSGAADPAAVVTHGSARFTVLTPSVIRVEVSAVGAWDDAPSVAFVNRRTPVPAFDVKRAGSEIVIKTAAVELRCACGGMGARAGLCGCGTSKLLWGLRARGRHAADPHLLPTLPPFAAPFRALRPSFRAHSADDSGGDSLLALPDHLTATLRKYPFTKWTPPRANAPLQPTRNLHGTIRTLDRVGEAVRAAELPPFFAQQSRRAVNLTSTPRPSALYINRSI
jgi:hypothetical protein